MGIDERHHDGFGRGCRRHRRPESGCLPLPPISGYTNSMLTYILLFLLGSFLGFLACEFADRWGCSKRYFSSPPKKLFIVFISGIAAAWLYWWEVQMGMLLPAETKDFHHPVAHHRYIIHLALFTFLLAATLTDFYEMIIPDSITITGTLAALIFALHFDFARLPVMTIHWTDDFRPMFGTMVQAMHVWSPNPCWTRSSTYLPYIMTLLWWFWCFAMLDRVWYAKLPFRKANAIFWRYLYRSSRTKYILATALFFPIVFATTKETGWDIALLSALVGMATGMILVWVFGWLPTMFSELKRWASAMLP